MTNTENSECPKHGEYSDPDETGLRSGKGTGLFSRLLLDRGTKCTCGESTMSNTEPDGDTRYQVTVEFDQQFSEYESPEAFVEACLNGNRSSSFARDITVVDAAEVESEDSGHR